MTSTVTRTLERNDALERQQEILHDISFSLGMRWAGIDHEFRTRIIDRHEGSRGVFALMKEWTIEFDTWWESQPKFDQDNYLEAIDYFTDNKINDLISTTVADRLAA